MASRRVVIVGAGITGLATAHALLERLPDVDLALLERASRPGGKISTEHADFFTKNLVAVRAEKRLALITRRPGSYVTGSFTTSPA